MMSDAGGRVLTALESTVLEQNAVALGMTVDALMENAGRAVAEEAAKRLPAPPGSVAIVAGPGNNGGDGTCAAFYLHQWGYTPELWLVRPPSEIRSLAARRCFDRIQRLAPTHLRTPRPEDLSSSPLIVDGLLGAGQSGVLRSPFREAVVAIRESRAPVLSIDVPTGVDDPNGLRPKWTVALTALKEGMTEANSGQIVVRDIGIPPEADRQTGPGEFLFFPRPSARTGLTRSARIIVIGGGPYSGAPALAALAALRSGAERATVVVPRPAADRVQSFSPNLVVVPIGSDRFRPPDVPEIVRFVRGQSPEAIVLGMGCGAEPETVEALESILADLNPALPVVVDADGLRGLPSPGRDRSGPIVATPNQGEFAHILGGKREGSLESRIESAQQIAADRRLHLIVKGDPDLLVGPGRVCVNTHHHPAQTVSGVGDVLGGTVGSLLGQGVAPFHAAQLATYWVGEAGDRAAGRRGFGLVATDVIEELPAALLDGLDRLRGAG
jgi:ADP-dependent NAD(P)H-hydrate dehydratase / NAD(P)H-hydrate epimerase